MKVRLEYKADSWFYHVIDAVNGGQMNLVVAFWGVRGRVRILLFLSFLFLMLTQ